MKTSKRFAVLAIVAILCISFMTMGCTTVTGWFCSNQATIQKIIDGANNTITTVESMFPGMIPPEYQVIIDVARNVVAQGEAYLAAGCPTDAQVSALQSQNAQVTSGLKSAGVAYQKAMRK